MGNSYYVVCLDCQQFMDLGKFWTWTVSSRGVPCHEEIEEDLRFLTEEEVRYRQVGTEVTYKDDWIRQALVLHGFLNQHNRHRHWIGDNNNSFIQEYISPIAHEEAWPLSDFYRDFTEVRCEGKSSDDSAMGKD